MNFVKILNLITYKNTIIINIGIQLMTNIIYHLYNINSY